jgi:regulator of sirC expression with transglutaminase-like and TPR domain
MPSQFAASPEFERLLRGDEKPDLIRIALEVAADAYPELDAGRYVEIIESLADRVRDRSPAHAKPQYVLGQINWVLFVEEGFSGNTESYYDPKNSYLNEVIDRKTGIPISLSILYWTLAERIGLPIDGVNLPAHFMLRVDRDGLSVYVDPFHGGVLLDRHGCQRRVSALLGRPVELTEQQLAGCGPKAVVTRMLRNLKTIYLETDDHLAALPIQRRLAALRRGDPDEQRDLGMLYLHADRVADAIDPLQAYLRACPGAADSDTVRNLVRAARREVALWN